MRPIHKERVLLRRVRRRRAAVGRKARRNFERRALVRRNAERENRVLANARKKIQNAPRPERRVGLKVRIESRIPQNKKLLPDHRKRHCRFVRLRRTLHAPIFQSLPRCNQEHRQRRYVLGVQLRNIRLGVGIRRDDFGRLLRSRYSQHLPLQCLEPRPARRLERPADSHRRIPLHALRRGHVRHNDGSRRKPRKIRRGARSNSCGARRTTPPLRA